MASEKDDRKSTGLLFGLASFFAFKSVKTILSSFSPAGCIAFFIVFAFIMAGIQFLIDRPVILAALGVAVALIALCVLICALIRNKKRKQLAKEQAEEEARIKAEKEREAEKREAEERARAEKSFKFLLIADDSPEAQATLKKMYNKKYPDISTLEHWFEICEDSAEPTAKVFFDSKYIGVIHYSDFPLEEVLNNPDQIENIEFYLYSYNDDFEDDDWLDEEEYFDDDFDDDDDYRYRHKRRYKKPRNVTYSATITFVMK